MGLMNDALVRLAGSRAVGRVARLVNTTLRPPVPVPIRVDGERLYAPRLDRVVALVLRKLAGGEAFETDLWRDLVTPGAVVADVGANLGLFALLAGRRAGPTGRVEAFEPDPVNFAMLQRAVATAGLAQVHPRRAGVSDADGSATLFQRPEHTGDHRLYAHEFQGNGDGTTVPVCKLDTVFGGTTGRLDAVKIDVQGLEWRVLAGMRELIKANPRMAVLCEFWPAGLTQSGGGGGEPFLAAARDAGFAVHLVDNDARVVRSATDAEVMVACPGDGYTNLLLKRGSL